MFFPPDLYTFTVPENAAVGSTVGRIMADDGDIGINARMTYTLEDDLEESATFIIQTDPVTQEGQLLLAKVDTFTLSTPQSQSVIWTVWKGQVLWDKPKINRTYLYFYWHEPKPNPNFSEYDLTMQFEH